MNRNTVTGGTQKRQTNRQRQTDTEREFLDYIFNVPFTL